MSAEFTVSGWCWDVFHDPTTSERIRKAVASYQFTAALTEIITKTILNRSFSSVISIHEDSFLMSLIATGGTEDDVRYLIMKGRLSPDSLSSWDTLSKAMGANDGIA